MPPPLAPAVTELWPADLARLAEQRWIAGCDRCREHLLAQCALGGFSPRIAFTTDDFVAVQALVTAGLGVALLPGLALRAARNPGVRTAWLRGTRRSVVAVRYGEPPDPPATALLLDALRLAAAGVPSSPGPAVGPGARVGRRPTLGARGAGEPRYRRQPLVRAAGWPRWPAARAATAGA